MRHNLNTNPISIYLLCVFLKLFRQWLLSEVAHEGTNH